MDAAQLVADRFEDISSRCADMPPTSLSEPDRIIWYVVSTRCEMDMEGFDSVFEQLLSEEELLFLIGALEKLDEPALAGAFRRAHVALQQVGFYSTPGALCHQFGPELEAELSAIEEFLQSELWELDGKLAALTATN